MVPTKLAAEWEAKLAAEGMPPEPNATPSTHRRAGFHRVIEGEFWRRAEIAAAMLPHGWPRGHFIRKAVLLGNVRRAARECRLTEKAGEWAWRKFLVFAGLPAPLVKGSPGRKRPTRDGLVRIEAGRYREERAA